jgi:hypothetical protein
MVDLPPAQVCSQIADSDGEYGVDAVLRAPVEAEQRASLIEEGNIGDDERENLNHGGMSATMNLLQRSAQHRLTDSVAPVAIPCKMRHAMCSWNDRLIAAPIVLPTSRRQQPSKIGRRPKTMHKGKIMKAPAFLSAT